MIDRYIAKLLDAFYRIFILKESSFASASQGTFFLDLVVRDRHKISLSVLTNLNELVTYLSNDFRGERSLLIRLNSVSIKNKI